MSLDRTNVINSFRNLISDSNFFDQCRMITEHEGLIDVTQGDSTTTSSIFLATRFLLLVHNVSKSHSVSGQNSGIAVDENYFHPQRASNGASMLSTCSSKASKNMTRCIVPFGLHKTINDTILSVINSFIHR